ncbi:ComF family protein [Paenibacillus anaericanus]|uniref:ComF family protein n=1 Tax=Paenibacillus anaericanus TaxID=170367 RepID=A0A433Y479_9BACL|nr:ComF family protein [Paenibacillus anaericanus]RUT42979.1 ComF family protein [Paenibacillus anaericanus]
MMTSQNPTIQNQILQYGGGEGVSWKTLLSSIHNLLSPQGVSCLVCGKMISAIVRGYPELCHVCYASIPWIMKPRCYTCGRPVGCPDCSRQSAGSRNFILNRSAVAYNTTMREWLGQYKFRGHEAYGPVLSRMMGSAMTRMLQELAAEQGGASVHFDAVTFVPISEERLMERGFNQAELLARGAASVSGIPLLALLERTRHTEKQSFKNRRERLHDIQGLFQLLPDVADKLEFVLQQPSHKPSLRSRFTSQYNVTMAKSSIFSKPSDVPITLLLIDDVYTTGSTIDACSEVLLEGCSQLGRKGEIYCFTWARS